MSSGGAQARSGVPQPPSLDALVHALCDPANYPHPLDGPVRVIETHISMVLVGGGHAYKLKKPLDLGFLDFSTLERRRECCDLEVRLNRRLAPSIYLGVVAVRWDGCRATIVPSDGAVPDAAIVAAQGPVVEHAVHMRAFDPDDLLDRRLAEGRLEPGMIDAVAATVASFHGAIAVAADDSAFGTAQAAWAPVRANFDALSRAVHDPLQRAVLAGLARWARRERRRLAPWFEARRRGGFVRECHGDLHLGNIAWVDGEPCVFDCIEFNPELRWTDVAAEVAFTVMDLADRGRTDLGWRLLDAWLAATGDHAALPGLRFYLCYRALVRAKVATVRLAQPSPDGAGTAHLRQEEEGYVALAAALSRAQPMLMITHGFSGSGKSHGASRLLERIGAVRVRSDVERKRLAGLAALDRHAAGDAVGAGLYAADATRHTYERLASAACAALDGGFPVIVDAAFLQRAARDRFRLLAERMKVPFVILSFSAPEAELRARVAARARTGHDASDAGPAVLEHQLANAQPLQPEEHGFVVDIDASAGAAAAALDAAAALLATHGVASPPVR